MEKELGLRKAVWEDAGMILSWRNDIETRINSFNQDEIDVMVHNKWFRDRLEDSSCEMYILTADGVDVGFIRGDFADNICEISYMIAPEHRGRGFGKRIISEFENTLEKRAAALVGFVKWQNDVSNHCFKSNGYTELIVNHIRCYIKVL